METKKSKLNNECNCDLLRGDVIDTSDCEIHQTTPISSEKEEVLEVFPKCPICTSRNIREVATNKVECATCHNSFDVRPTPPLEVKEGWEKWVKVLANSKNPRDVDLLIVKVKVLLSQTIQETKAKIKMELIQKIKDSHLHLGYKNNILELLDK